MSPGGRTHPAAFVGAGLSAIIGLHAVFILGWDAFFNRVPWPGYEESTRLGMIEPWFVNTPRSLWLTRAVLFILAFAVLLPIRRGRIARAVALWVGAAAGTALLYATTVMRTFDGGAAGFVFYPLRVGLPILAGALVATAVQRVTAGRAGATTS